MEGGGRSNVGNFTFTHQEKEEEGGGSVSDEENGNVEEPIVLRKDRRVLHYSTEDIHLLATQVEQL